MSEYEEKILQLLSSIDTSLHIMQQDMAIVADIIREMDQTRRNVQASNLAMAKNLER